MSLVFCSWVGTTGPLLLLGWDKSVCSDLGSIHPRPPEGNIHSTWTSCCYRFSGALSPPLLPGASAVGLGCGSVMAVNRGPSTKWLFTRETLENTPSRRCGIEADRELSYRQQAANLIQDIGQRLNVYPFWKIKLDIRLALTTISLRSDRRRKAFVLKAILYNVLQHSTYLVAFIIIAKISNSLV